MGFGPIGYALRVYSQVAPGSPQVHTIHIKLNCLLANFRTVATGFLDWSIFTATQIAPIPLTTRGGLANLVLLFCALTFWTSHYPILPLNLGTPKGDLPVALKETTLPSLLPIPSGVRR